MPQASGTLQSTIMANTAGDPEDTDEMKQQQMCSLAPQYAIWDSIGIFTKRVSRFVDTVLGARSS